MHHACHPEEVPQAPGRAKDLNVAGLGAEVGWLRSFVPMEEIGTRDDAAPCAERMHRPRHASRWLSWPVRAGEARGCDGWTREKGGGI